jgi:ferredoxin--NADP+ reductase
MKFGCVDGPDFDGHRIDFNLLNARNRRYLEEEKAAVEKFRKEGS